MPPKRPVIPAWPLVLGTRRLVLRPLAPTDHAAWSAGHAGRRPPRHKYDSGPPAAKRLTRARFLRLCRHHAKLAREDAVYVWAIFRRRDGQHLGAVDVSTIRRDDNQWANLGYSIHNQHVGRGYATEAVGAVLRGAFAKLGFQRLEAAINLDNRRSVALAKAAGLRREGMRRQFIHENGGWVDHLIYAAVPGDVGLRPKKPRFG